MSDCYWDRPPCHIPKQLKRYGQMHLANGKIIYQHRATYAQAVGLLALGKDTLHWCDNKACDEPAHLSAGTRADNMRDAQEKGRLVRRKDNECMKKHKLTAENTYISEGRIRCLECLKLRGPARNERRREARRIQRCP